MNRQIGIIERCNTLYRNDAFKEFGLCGCHHTYIINVCKNPGITQEELSNKIHINKSNVTRNITFLEENGFVVRKENPKDKRSFCIYPTDKANEILPKVFEILHKWDNTLTSFLSDDEKTLLNELLTKVAKRALEEVGDR